jgi:recombination protein RecA
MPFSTLKIEKVNLNRLTLELMFWYNRVILTRRGVSVAVKSARGARQVIQNVAGLFAGRSARPVLPTAFNFRPATDIMTLSTGFRPLDKALGIGGLPRGKITELMSPGSLSSSGAVMLAAGIAARVQRKQQIVTILDMGHYFDPWQAERCGLVAPHLLLTRPETVFEALTTLEGVAGQEGLVLVVMGVVVDLLKEAEPDLLKTLLGRLRGIIRQANSAFLFITSSLDDDPFNPANYPAGFPLAEIAEIRLWVQDESWTQRDGIAVAYKANLTVIKNQLAIAGTGANVRITMAR